jgi:hypothetical protein
MDKAGEERNCLIHRSAVDAKADALRHLPSLFNS